MSKKNWSGFGGAVIAVAAGCFAWVNRRWFTVSDITTGESAAYPELRSRVYYAEMERAMAAAEQALKRLPGWSFVSRDAGNDILEATARASFGPLTDDVTVYFFALGHGQTRVTVRSRSRTSLGDFGRNAVHIRDLQRAMDNRLNTESAL